jgi:predicted AAA+ superfamily ATPase
MRENIKWKGINYMALKFELLIGINGSGKTHYLENTIIKNLENEQKKTKKIIQILSKC